MQQLQQLVSDICDQYQGILTHQVKEIPVRFGLSLLGLGLFKGWDREHDPIIP